MDQASFVFMANIMHEITNPLTGMHTTVQVLEQQLIAGDEINPDELRGDLRNLKTEIERLMLLLHDLRRFGQSRRLRHEPVSLRQVAAEILAMERHEYQRRGIGAELQFPPSLPCIMADRQQLKQVLLNLCKNAAEAMPAGGKLVVRGLQNGDTILVEIEDTGVGICDEENLFDPFNTAKPDGLGLGLAIAQKIVSAHGGLISYEKKSKDGTIFRIAIPSRGGFFEHACGS